MRTNHFTYDRNDVFRAGAGIRNSRVLVDTLSPRCREVLHGLVAGQSNKVIAYNLGISPRTVEAHRANLMRHLGARHLADAIRVALEAAA
jgi:two-component system response regulator FixJ